MELMVKFNAKKHDAYKIGYVMIRGNSDYLNNPMQLSGGVWSYAANAPAPDFTSCVLLALNVC